MSFNVFQLDDDPDQIELFAKLCENEEEFEHFGFETCDTFLKALKQNTPDVCIIDVNLTEGSGVGFVVVEAIRNRYSNDLPIFLLTRRKDPKDISYAFELGVTDYIIKPIDPLLISEKVKSYVVPNHRSKLPTKRLEKPITAKLLLNLKLLRLDESYLYFESDHFFLKQSVIHIENRIINEIFFKDDYYFRVHLCELQEKTGKYLLTLIAKDDDSQYYEDLKYYLSKRREKNEN